MYVRRTWLLCFVLCLPWLGSPAARGDADPPVEQTVRADDGLKIVCEVRGAGETALVFLHGWCGSREVWKHQVDVFDDRYRVVTLDLAGHGASGTDRQGWTIESLAGDVAAVVKTLALNRVVLVGHSMSGPVALAAAKRLPDAVVAVIGADTLQNAELVTPPEQIEGFLQGLEADFPGTLGNGLQGMLPEDVAPALRQSLADLMTRQSPRMAIPLMRDLSRVDSKKLFREAGVPIRCINAGSGFRFATPTVVDTNRKYADYDVVIIDGVGHFPMLEKPEQFNARLAAFLKEVAPRE